MPLWSGSAWRSEVKRDPEPGQFGKLSKGPISLHFQRRNLLVSVSAGLRFSIPLFIFITCGLIVAGCNRGLAPVQPSPNGQTGFGGEIHFVSPWPPADTVQDLRVVAFYKYPPTNIFTEVLSGQAIVYPAIGTTGLSKFVDSVSYAFTLDSASTFQYIVVAMQYGPDVFHDWRVVGAYGYSHGAGSPRAISVPPNAMLKGIDIDVDFQNTPPTPLGGVASASRRH